MRRSWPTRTRRWTRGVCVVAFSVLVVMVMVMVGVRSVRAQTLSFSMEGLDTLRESITRSGGGEETVEVVTESFSEKGLEILRERIEADEEEEEEVTTVEEPVISAQTDTETADFSEQGLEILRDRIAADEEPVEVDEPSSVEEVMTVEEQVEVQEQPVIGAPTNTETSISDPLFSMQGLDMLRATFGADGEEEIVKVEDDDPAQVEYKWSLPGDTSWPSTEELEVLRENIDGSVYDARSVPSFASRPPPYWWGNIGSIPRPAVVVEVENEPDVAAALAFAKRAKLRIAVYSTGHDFQLRSVVENGMLINMRRMNTIQVREDLGYVAVGTGAVYSDILKAVYNATDARFTVPSGYHESVGPYGFTTGGGISITATMYGPGSDSIVGLDCIDAQGRMLKVMEGDDEHAELLRAVRGGGTTFCVATTMYLRLVPELGPVMAYSTEMYTMYTGLEQIREFATSSGDMDKSFFWYQHVRGSLFPTKFIAGCFMTDDEDECKARLGPLLSVGPVWQTNQTQIELLRYETHYDFMDDLMFGYIDSGSPTQAVYQKSIAVPADHLKEEGVLDDLYAFSRNAPLGTIASFNVRPLSAGSNTVATAAAADADLASMTSLSSQFRNATLFINCLLTWGVGTIPAIPMSYVSAFYDSVLRDLGTEDGWQYINEATEMDNWQNRLWNGPEGYERLLRVKHEYDPEGLFQSRYGIGSEEVTDGDGADPLICPALCQAQGRGCTNIGQRDIECAPLPRFDSKEDSDDGLMDDLQRARTAASIELV